MVLASKPDRRFLTQDADHVDWWDQPQDPTDPTYEAGLYKRESTRPIALERRQASTLEP
jgi:hypothetical protein